MTNIFDTTKGDDLETFIESFLETIAWCSQVIDISDFAKAFRSDQLEPHLWSDGRKDMVVSIARRRHMNVRHKVTRDIATLPKGRLLIYFPDYTVDEGATEAETSGFFDAHDAPPWDTWISYFYELDTRYAYLVSWVPADFIDIVSQGIEVSSTECIGWLDKIPDLAIYEMLKEHALL